MAGPLVDRERPLKHGKSIKHVCEAPGDWPMALGRWHKLDYDAEPGDMIKSSAGAFLLLCAVLHAAASDGDQEFLHDAEVARRFKRWVGNADLPHWFGDKYGKRNESPQGITRRA